MTRHSTVRPPAYLKRQLRNRRPKHRKIALHPVSMLFLLCIGVFVVYWTGQVVANDYTVTGVVPAKPLTKAATITSPTHGATFTKSAVKVSGWCPTESYVSLYVNQMFSGTASCSLSSTYNIQTSLANGTNRLTAQDFNITNQPGPVGETVTVTYEAEPATWITNPVSASTPSDATALQLLLASNFDYKTFAVSEESSWDLQLKGGTSPYTLDVAWGDGQTSRFGPQNDATFHISHRYEKAGSYSIIVTSWDKTGRTRIMQLAVLVTSGGTAGRAAAGTAGPNIINDPGTAPAVQPAKHWLWFVWPPFIITVLMVGCFWLGERKEYALMLENAAKKQRPPRRMR